ncbi:hypothetical protein O91_00933, partial [Bartonella quintana JK 31]
FSLFLLDGYFAPICGEIPYCFGSGWMSFAKRCSAICPGGEKGEEVL